MFKKGQLVRVKELSVRLWVISECVHTDGYVVQSLTGSRFNYVNGRHLKLIGNNYKEKPCTK